MIVDRCWCLFYTGTGGASRKTSIQPNPSRRDVSYPTRHTAMNNKQQVAENNAADLRSPSQRNTSPAADFTEDEYNTAAEETPTPRRAPISVKPHSAQYPVSSSSSSVLQVCSCSSSSTPQSVHRPDEPLGRIGSVTSAPPSTGLLAPPRRADTRRSSIADVASAIISGTPLPDAVSPVSDTPRKSVAAASKPPPARFPPRKQHLNPNPRPFRALCCLTLNNPLRKLCIRIVEYKYPFTVHK